MAAFERLVDTDWLFLENLRIDGMHFRACVPDVGLGFDWGNLTQVYITDEIELERSRELQYLRDLYIPQIFLWLTQVLYETRELIPG